MDPVVLAAEQSFERGPVAGLRGNDQLADLVAVHARESSGLHDGDLADPQLVREHVAPWLAEVGEPHQHEAAIGAAQVQLDLARAQVVALVDRRTPVSSSRPPTSPATNTEADQPSDGEVRTRSFPRAGPDSQKTRPTPSLGAMVGWR